MNDVIIIGAGIIGSFLAYDLSKYQLKVLVLEKENDVANVTTMANSAIVHAGYDPEDNTLKALLNVKGSQMYPKICQNLQVPYQKIGAFVVGGSQEDEVVLKKMVKRAKKRGVRYQKLDKQALHQAEPNLAKRIYCGVSFPDTAIIDPFLTAITLMEVAIENKVVVKLNQEVIKINKKDKSYEVVTADNSYQTKVVINAAGLKSDQIAAMVNDFSFKINYFKGEYYVLDKRCKDFVKHVIYPTPSQVGKGVLVVPTLHDNILLGPTSKQTLTPLETNTTTIGRDLIASKLSLIVKDVPLKYIIRSFAGIRAKVASKDFTKYGKIVCRCEQISEQEIIDNIKRPLPATSIKAIKKRCRPGMGKCQGGFCQPLITQLLAKHLDCELTEVNYDAQNSAVLHSFKGDSYE